MSECRQKHPQDFFFEGESYGFKRIDQEIIRSDLEGPLAMPLVMNFSDRRDQLIKEILAERGIWYSIIVLHKSCLMDQNLQANVPAFLNRYVDEGIAASSSCLVMASDIEGRNDLTSFFASLYASTGIIFQIFESYEEALVWTQGHRRQNQNQEAS